MKSSDYLMIGAIGIGGYLLYKSGIIGGLTKTSEGLGDAAGGFGDAVVGVGGAVGGVGNFIGDFFGNIGGFFDGLADGSDLRRAAADKNKQDFLSDLGEFGTPTSKIGKSTIPVYASPTNYNKALRMPVSSGISRNITFIRPVEIQKPTYSVSAPSLIIGNYKNNKNLK